MPALPVADATPDRFRRACYAAEGILRGLEGSPEAAHAALEKLRWAIQGHPDPDRIELERLRKQLNANCLQRDALQILVLNLRDALSGLMVKIDEYEIGLPEDALRSDYAYWEAACAAARAVLVEIRKYRP